MSKSDSSSGKRLLNKIRMLNITAKVKVDIGTIVKAIQFAKKYHAGQFRKSGEPFYTHPVEVAYMLCEYCFKTDILVTAILHDTIEDTAATVEIISEQFGSKIAQNVMDLTRVKNDGTKITAAQVVDDLFTQRKYDLLLVKQFDRLHNMQTLGVKSPDKIERTVKETIYTFSTLAAYLGTVHIESKIIDLCSQMSQNLGNSKQELKNWQDLNDNQLLAQLLRLDQSKTEKQPLM